MYNLISTITELPKLVGCHDFPTDQQGMQLIKLISDFINEEYHYNGHQVTEAFLKAVKRELYLDSKRVDPSTFGQHLSVNVVGQVLTAYKESLRDGKARPQAYNYNQLPEVKKEPLTPREALEMIVKWCREDNRLPLGAPYNTAYKYLVETNRIKPVEKNSNRFADNELLERKAVEKWLKDKILK